MPSLALPVRGAKLCVMSQATPVPLYAALEKEVSCCCCSCLSLVPALSSKHANVEKPRVQEHQLEGTGWEHQQSETSRQDVADLLHHCCSTADQLAAAHVHLSSMHALPQVLLSRQSKQLHVTDHECSCCQTSSRQEGRPVLACHSVSGQPCCRQHPRCTSLPASKPDESRGAAGCSAPWQDSAMDLHGNGDHPQNRQQAGAGDDSLQLAPGRAAAAWELCLAPAGEKAQPHQQSVRMVRETNRHGGQQRPHAGPVEVLQLCKQAAQGDLWKNILPLGWALAGLAHRLCSGLQRHMLAWEHLTGSLGVSEGRIAELQAALQAAAADNAALQQKLVGLPDVLPCFRSFCVRMRGSMWFAGAWCSVHMHHPCLSGCDGLGNPPIR